MGRIRRQGLGSSILVYVGLILGFINSAILFPKILGPEIFGFCQFLIQASTLIGVVSLMGLPNTTIRFFPYFKNKTTQHEGFLAYLIITGGALTMLAAILLVIFKPQILSWFGAGDPEMYLQNFFWALVALTVLANFNRIFGTYATALMRPRIPTFLNEVAGRLLTLGLILAFYFSWISEDAFISFYALKAIIITAGLILFLFVIRELHSRVNAKIIRNPAFREMWKYGAYAIFAQLGGQLINRIDMIMLAALLTFKDVGIYTVFFFLSTVIGMSHFGFSKIVSPIIADYWKNGKKGEIAKLNSRMALNNLIIGVLVFIGILVNLENAIQLLGEQYREGLMVAVFLGIAQLLNVMNGYNGYIIIHSKKYRYDLLFKSITVIITILTNFIFIQAYGLVGAAIATAITIILINALYQYFVIKNFNMHPFSWKMLLVIFVGTVVTFLIYFLPRIPGHFAWDIIVKSSLVIILYGFIVLKMQISADVNTYYKDALSFIKKQSGIN